MNSCLRLRARFGVVRVFVEEKNSDVRYFLSVSRNPSSRWAVLSLPGLYRSRMTPPFCREPRPIVHPPERPFEVVGCHVADDVGIVIQGAVEDNGRNAFLPRFFDVGTSACESRGARPIPSTFRVMKSCTTLTWPSRSFREATPSTRYRRFPVLRCILGAGMDRFPEFVRCPFGMTAIRYFFLRRRRCAGFCRLGILGTPDRNEAEPNEGCDQRQNACGDP